MITHTVGVTTVLYNSSGHLKRFVEGLILNKGDISFVVFVDNNSQDDSRTLIGALKGIIPYTIIANSKNKGYSYAVNQGISFLRDKGYEHILVTNNDITIQERGVSALLCDMVDTHADVVGVPTTNDKKSYVISNEFDKKANEVKQKVLTKEKLQEVLKDKIAERTAYVQGGVILFNETFFKKVGVYDPFLFFGGDELDFLFRISLSKDPVLCYVSLGSWDHFDHHTYHDGRFKILKAKMIMRGVVYVLFKHGHHLGKKTFWHHVRKMYQELGKNSVKRYFVLSIFLLQGVIISMVHILELEVNKRIKK